MHRPRLIAVGLGIWSLFTGLSGLARSFTQLAAARLMVGIGEATLTPAALAMLSDIFPEHWRARATGIFAIGLPIGSGFSLVVAGILAPRYGWRACFFVLGMVGVLAAVVVAMLPDPRPELAKGDARDTQQAGLGGNVEMDVGGSGPAGDFLAVLRRSPALALTILGGVIVTFSTAATIHVVTWLVRERGFEFRDAAIMAGGIYAVGGTVGNIAGGWFADVCAARWRAGRLWSLVLTHAVLAPPTLLFFSSARGSTAFYIGWVLSSLRGTIWYGPLYAATQDLAPSHARATSVAFLMLAINLLGAGPGPWLAGAIGDRVSLTQGLIVTTWVGMLAVVPFALAARSVRPPGSESVQSPFRVR
jgi:MFS family permease